MTSAHVFYIPALLLLGITIGIAIGRKLLLAEQAAERRRAERMRALDPPAG